PPYLPKPLSAWPPAAPAALLIEHADVPWMARDSLQPGADRRVAFQFEATLLGDMGIGIKRHIRDGIVITDQVRGTHQLLLHHVQRVIAIVALGFVFLAALFRHPEVHLDVSGDRQKRLMAVLLEELPLQNLGP